MIIYRLLMMHEIGTTGNRKKDYLMPNFQEKLSLHQNTKINIKSNIYNNS